MVYTHVGEEFAHAATCIFWHALSLLRPSYVSSYRLPLRPHSGGGWLELKSRGVSQVEREGGGVGDSLKAKKIKNIKSNRAAGNN